MKILAIDTAGWECSMALWESGREIIYQAIPSERDQATLLPYLLKDVLGSHKVDQIIVNVGPGSFTGIRVGLAFAKGFAMGQGLPLKGIDGFMAAYQSIDYHEDVLVLIDSRRQDIFGRRFLAGAPQAPQSLQREDIEKILLGSPPPLVTGRNFQSFLKDISFKEAFSPWRGAQSLAYAFFKNPNAVSDPLPFYVREADVTVSKSYAHQTTYA